MKKQLEDGNLFRYGCAAAVRGGLGRDGGREIQSRAFLDEVGIGNAASARKAAIRLCELRYIYLFRGEYRFTSMFFRAWLLRQDW